MTLRLENSYTQYWYVLVIIYKNNKKIVIKIGKYLKEIQLSKLK